MPSRNTRVNRSGISSQKSIKIDGVLWDELDSWLKTGDAKKQGFHSKADFTTQAVREMLRDYSEEINTMIKLKKVFRKHSKNLKNRGVKDPEAFIGYVDKMLKSIG